jgi:L-asparaginase
MIRLITCGGTIDKVYFDELSEYKVGESHVPSILEGMGLEFEHIPVCQKDSLKMTKKDRKNVLTAIAEIDQMILITHGTDTMIDTGKLIVENLEPHHKIVLTGSMQPAAFKNSDAVFNIAFALGALRALQGSQKPICQIAMNGQLFNPRYVKKNRELGKFEFKSLLDE